MFVFRFENNYWNSMSIYEATDQSIGTPLLLTSPLKAEESNLLRTLETKPLIFILINHLGSSTIPKAPYHRGATHNLRDNETDGINSSHRVKCTKSKLLGIYFGEKNRIDEIIN